MNLDNKVIFTTDEDIKQAILAKFSLKKENNLEYEIYSGKRETEEEYDNILLVYCHINRLIDTISYVKDNYLIQKFMLLGTSFITINQDIETGDIMIPNSFINEKGDNPIFLEYAIGENFDLNKFGLILNGVCGDSIKNSEIVISEEIYFDVYDNDSYTFLSTLTKEELDISVVIRLCVKTDDDVKNNYFIENLLNIVDVMI